MQNLLLLFSPQGEALGVARESLEAMLFGLARPVEQKGAVGQFFPGAAGGPNAQVGFDADSKINPWAFVMMLEGSLWFAAAASKRMGSSGNALLSSPFTVRSSGVGYSSAASVDEDKTRGEVWLPMWDKPCSLLELQSLLAEGRARLGKRKVTQGVDFARAINSLGVDRGLTSFVRYGIHERNGRAFLASSLGRFRVGANPQASLLMELDNWLRSFRRRVGADQAPGSLKRQGRLLDRAIMGLCQRRDPLLAQEVLCVLGECAQAMTASHRWVMDSDKGHLPPVPLLKQAWLAAADDESIELRLAAGFASQRLYLEAGNTLSMRSFMEPVEASPKKVWWQKNPGRDVVWQHGRPVESMLAMLHRMMLLVSQKGQEGWRVDSTCVAPLDDVVAFIEGRVDDARLASLMQAMSLLSWVPPVSRPRGASTKTVPLGAGFALMKLCFAGVEVREQRIPLQAAIVHQARAGRMAQATSLAARRLRGSGLVPGVESVDGSPTHARRAAAALLFPLGQAALETLQAQALRPPTQD